MNENIDIILRIVRFSRGDPTLRCWKIFQNLLGKHVQVISIVIFYTLQNFIALSKCRRMNSESQSRKVEKLQQNDEICWMKNFPSHRCLFYSRCVVLDIYFSLTSSSHKQWSLLYACMHELEANHKKEISTLLLSQLVIIIE